jgi:F-type H+-transporting ATPase subunit epsilon
MATIEQESAVLGVPPGQVRCVIVTPERAVLDDRFEFVVLPMYDGELGVLHDRAPLIGRLGAGELRLRRGSEERRYFVDGGFAQVRANVVSVLTPRAVRAEDIDPGAASAELAQALTPAANAKEQEVKLKAQERGRAQLRIANRARGGAAGHHG